MNWLARFARSQSGGAAVEFALVVPAALLLFFGVIDGGRYLWAVNRMEKAVQMGTRTAVVTGVVPIGLNDWDLRGSGMQCIQPGAAGPTDIQSGDQICKEVVGTIVCSRASATAAVACTCTESAAGAGSCPDDLGTPDGVANQRFARIMTRIRVVDPSIQDNEVDITYSGSGIGYAGDPSEDDAGNALADAAPVVTVSINRAQMRALFLLGGRIPLPDFSYSQTLEDGDGVVSY